MSLSARKVGQIFLLLIIIGSVFGVVRRIQYLKTHPAKISLALTPQSDEKIIVPAFPDSTFISSETDPDEGMEYIGNRFASTWQSNASVKEIAKWYSDKYQAEGWKLDFSPADSEADIQLISLYNDKYTLYVSVYKDYQTNKTKIITEYQTEHPDTFEVGENEEEETEEQMLKREGKQQIE